MKGKKKRGQNILWVLLLIFPLSLLLFWAISPNEESLAIGVSPPSFDVGSLNPGESKEFEITVFNPNMEGDPLIVESRVVDFSKDEKGELILPEGMKFDTPIPKYRWASEWVEIIENQKIMLKPQEQRKLRLRIEVPSQAEPGEKYFGIIIIGKPIEAQGMITFHDAVLCQCFVNVGGERIIDLSINPPEFEKGLFSTKAKYRVKVINQGNSFLDLRGLFLRFYHQGDVKIEKNLGTPLLLPIVEGMNEINYRIIEGEVSFPSWPRKYQVRVECGYPLARSSPQVEILIIPLWFVLAIIVSVLLIIVIVFLIWFRKKKERKKVEEEGEEEKEERN